MESGNNILGSIGDILSGRTKPTAEVITSADSSWNNLVINFWLFGVLAFIIGLFVYKFVNK